MNRTRNAAAVAVIGIALAAAPPGRAQDGEKPHAVFVVGTPHYNPAATLPPLAQQLERFGFRVTLILPAGNPEGNKNGKGLPGLEVLQDADVAIFFLRFLALPEDQLHHMLHYVKSGKPVVGLRTTTHAFRYPKGHALARWNDDFGRLVMGSKYFLHMTGSTKVEVLATSRGHPILTGFGDEAVTAAGTLYRTELPKDAVPLLKGTGNPKRTGTVTNGFGTHELKEVETSVVAWAWKNQWGGRVFGTTIGHPGSFRHERFVRMMINGIHWAAGRPVPAADAKVETLPGGISHHQKTAGQKGKSRKKRKKKPAPEKAEQ